MPRGLFFDVAYNTGIVSLEVEGILGDYSRNGVVDAVDYIVWRKTLGQRGSGLAANGDRSGAIDAGDDDVWHTNFGQVAPFPGAPALPRTGVPEPATWVLLAFASILIATHSSRHRHIL